jgi:cytochrome c-type biogenesis protein CcmH
LILGVWLFANAGAMAQVATSALAPMTPELEARLKKLETELRCLVCQNQTLAESPAGLAGDLRREIRMLADSGKSNEEIKQHLKDRYGDFVLYKPQLDTKTLLLWFGPFLLLAGGAVIVLVINRRVRRVPAEAPAMADQEQDRARKLLDDEDK